MSKIGGKRKYNYKKLKIASAKRILHSLKRSHGSHKDKSHEKKIKEQQDLTK